MLVVLLAYIVPVLLVVSNSLKPESDILSDPLGPPPSVTLHNYVDAYQRMNFLGSFVNTLVITVSSVVVICLFGSMTAYFLTRVRWAPNQFVFYLMIVSMMVPFQVLMIPMIKILGDLGLLNQNWIIVYVYFASGVPMAVFLYAGFIRSIPRELDEAATLDGCNRVRTFFYVIFPLLRPITITIVVLDVLMFWSDFLMPFLVLRRPEQRTLTLSTMAFVQSHTTEYGPMMAALIMSVIPVFLAYLFLQRHVIDGMVKGAVK
ncbi:sugar ABC transporter permease [Streptomyces canus]|uniref:Sugar ABC transporter permease n=2 Tax=Streptomyces canus TaxID=58343 RepID=A0A101RK92_9ACTN|nr:sugar ABC transporter permease [Streptomyces canus]